MDKPVLLKSDFPEIYFLGSNLKRYDTCQFGLMKKKLKFHNAYIISSLCGEWILEKSFRSIQIL